MKILMMESTECKQPIRYHLIKELKDGYLIYYFSTYGHDSDEVNIRLRIEVTVDEYFWLQDPSNEANINKFKERLDDELSRYVWRNMK